MIGAKEARSFADEVTIAPRQRKEYQILIDDIEQKIVQASKMGKYSISYWLSDVYSSGFKEIDSSDPVISAQLYNHIDSSLCVKIKNDLIKAGYEVEETTSPAALYYWTIKWDKEGDGYDFI